MVKTRKMNTVDPEHLRDAERVREHALVFHDIVERMIETPWGVIAEVSNLRVTRHPPDNGYIYVIDRYGHKTIEEATLHLMALANGVEINDARNFASFAYNLLKPLI